MTTPDDDTPQKIDDLAEAIIKSIKAKNPQSDEYHQSGQCPGFDFHTGKPCQHPACVTRRAEEDRKLQEDQERWFRSSWIRSLVRQDCQAFTEIHKIKPNKYQEQILLAIKDRWRLTITGKAGIGKTTGAFLICYHQKLIPEVINTSDLAEISESVTRRIEELKDARAVIIDDLGVEGNEVGKRRLYSILDHRDKIQKLTIITTNFSITKLNQEYDDRIIRRISPILDLRDNAIYEFRGEK